LGEIQHRPQYTLFHYTNQMTNHNPQDAYSYKLPPNPRTESEETIKDYEEQEIARRALRITQGYIEITPE